MPPSTSQQPAASGAAAAAAAAGAQRDIRIAVRCLLAWIRAVSAASSCPPKPPPPTRAGNVSCGLREEKQKPTRDARRPAQKGERRNTQDATDGTYRRATDGGGGGSRGELARVGLGGGDVYGGRRRRVRAAAPACAELLVQARRALQRAGDARRQPTWQWDFNLQCINV